MIGIDRNSRLEKTNTIESETARQKTDRLLKEACEGLKNAVREKQDRSEFGLVTVEVTMAAGNISTLVLTQGRSVK